MDDLYKRQRECVLRETDGYVLKLSHLWSSLFPEHICRGHMENLVQYVKSIYDNLLDESMDKKGLIEKEINALREEAEALQGLLQVNVQLPEFSEDVPLLTMQLEMDKSLSDYRDELRKRRAEIDQLLLEQEGLCDELGEPPRQLLTDPLPISEELSDFRDHLRALRDLRMQRINQLSDMRRDIKNFLKVLDLKVETDTDDRLLNHRGIKLSQETLLGLQRLHDRLREKVEQLSSNIDTARSKLEKIWDRLGTSRRTRRKFDRYTEYNQETFDAISAELQRCELIKKQDIRKYVEQIRQEIARLWDKCMISEVERSRFSHFNSTYFTEDLLIIHELELDDLKAHYEMNRPIFKLYAERKSLWDRMCALEAKATDHSRYNNRGGELLREEKERKTIATELPKIEEQIVALAREYQRRENKPFHINGEDIIDVMASDWDKKRQEKELLVTARKKLQTPHSEAGQRSAMITPLSVKSSPIASMRRAPPSTDLSAWKRKLPHPEAVAPVAKRSLIGTLDSLSVLRKPDGGIASTPAKPPIKSLLKEAKVLRCNTACRKSERKSGAFAKNADSTAKEPGKTSTVNMTCADTDSDSGNLQGRIKAGNSTRPQIRRQGIIGKENASLPVPRLPRAQSRQNMLARPGRSPHKVTANGLKLANRNLPIMM